MSTSKWVKKEGENSSTKKPDFLVDFRQCESEADNLVASSGDVRGACDLLAVIEKKTRLANDLTTLKLVVEKIITLAFATLQSTSSQNKEEEKVSLIEDQILSLAKKRGQKSAAITVVVQKSMAFLEELAPSKLSEKNLVKLIVGLRLISDGKIYVEKERAQLTMQLAMIKEKNGETAEAADILQQVHVETYGAMTPLEKIEFILEQVRLTLAKKDYVRARILSKKIIPRKLLAAGFEWCKLKFYHLMIEYDTHENTVLNLAQHYFAIHQTVFPTNEKINEAEGDDVKMSDDKKEEKSTTKIICSSDMLQIRHHALLQSVLFSFLSPYGPEQSDLILRCREAIASFQLFVEEEEKKDKSLKAQEMKDELKKYAEMLKFFTRREILASSQLLTPLLAEHTTLNDQAMEVEAHQNKDQMDGRYVIFPSERKETWRKELKKRVDEYNIRVVAEHYDRIGMAHLAKMLSLSTDLAEETISQLVTCGSIYAKIDRPAGIICFQKPVSPENSLTNWSGDISELLKLVETTCHLINKENMTYKI